MSLLFLFLRPSSRNHSPSPVYSIPAWIFTTSIFWPGGAIFGNPLTQEGIAQINQLFDFLSGEENLKTEGLFRKSGNIARQRELKVLLDTGSDLNLSEQPQNFSPHDCANVLKSFLGETVEPFTPSPLLKP